MHVHLISCLLLLELAFCASGARLRRLENYHPPKLGMCSEDYIELLDDIVRLIRTDILDHFFVGVVLDSDDYTMKVLSYFLPGFSIKCLTASSNGHPERSIEKLHVARDDFFEPNATLATFSTGQPLVSDAYGIAINVLAKEGDIIDADKKPIFLVYEFAEELPPALPEAHKWLDKIESRKPPTRIADLYASDPKYRPLQASFSRVSNFHKMKLLSQQVLCFAKAEATHAAVHFKKPVNGLFHEIISSFYSGSLPRVLKYNGKSASLVKKVKRSAGAIANIGDVVIDFRKGFFKVPHHVFIFKVLVDAQTTVKPGQPLLHVLGFGDLQLTSTENGAVAPWFGPAEPILDVFTSALLSDVDANSRRIVSNGDERKLSFSYSLDLPEQDITGTSSSSTMLINGKFSKPTCSRKDSNAVATPPKDFGYLPLYKRVLSQIRSMLDLTKLQEHFINRMQLLRQNIPGCKQLTCPIPSVISIGAPIATSLSQSTVKALASGVAVKGEHHDSHCSIYILTAEE